jgi:hypothetical protein
MLNFGFGGFGEFGSVGVFHGEGVIWIQDVNPNEEFTLRARWP